MQKYEFGRLLAWLARYGFNFLEYYIHNDLYLIKKVTIAYRNDGCYDQEKILVSGLAYDEIPEVVAKKERLNIEAWRNRVNELKSMLIDLSERVEADVSTSAIDLDRIGSGNEFYICITPIFESHWATVDVFADILEKDPVLRTMCGSNVGTFKHQQFDLYGCEMKKGVCER